MIYNEEVVKTFIKDDVKKFTEFVGKNDPVAILLLRIQEGNTFEDSCTISTISRAEFYAWKSKDSKQYHSEFSDAIKKARILGKAEHIRNIKTASRKYWTASAWWLERQYPAEFKEHKATEQESKDLEKIGNALQKMAEQGKEAK
jgi:hydroxylamine reductase (hybrid-cluster protein)